MKKTTKLISILLVLAMLLSMAPIAVFTVGAASAAYNGTPINPLKINESNYNMLGLTEENWSDYSGYYAIRNASELYGFAALVNGGDRSINGVLLQDIVVNTSVSASGAVYSWTPIGATRETAFLGTFDGAGHSISGIYYKNADATYVGLFGCMGEYGKSSGATVKNLTLKNSYFSGKNYVGGFVGCFFGYNVKVTHCKTDSDVSVVANHIYTVDKDFFYVGGIVGGFGGAMLNQTCYVSHCVNLASVIGNVIDIPADYILKTQNCDRYIGSIAGSWNSAYNAGVRVTVDGCYSLDNCVKVTDGDEVFYRNYVCGGPYENLEGSGTVSWADYRGSTVLSSATAAHTCVAVATPEIKANCTYGGHSAYSYCLICGSVTSGTKTVTESNDTHFYKGATCTANGVCQLCGDANGPKNPDNHISWIPANCMAPATCEFCSVTKGEKNPDNHTDADKFTYAVNETDESKHDAFYEQCKAFSHTEGHSYDAQGKCTKCTYECAHPAYTDGVCDTCAYKCAHSDIENNKCTVCGLEGSIKYINRVWNSTTKQVEETVEIAPVNITEFTAETAELTDGWYIVNGTVNNKKYMFKVSGTVHLILADGASLTTKGCIVNEGNSLYIYAQSTGADMGLWKLKDVYNHNAVLGGTESSSAGKIVINGGFIQASVSDRSRYGAAIGSGYNGTGGEIIINGGFVKASSYDGAAIGCGVDGTPGSISVNGGTVYASAEDGVGIGSGWSGKAGNVTINGGNIYGYSSSGKIVGAGYRGDPVTVTDGSGNDVTLRTITLSGAAADTPVTKVEGITYGLTDVKTYNTNKLYFWLPADAVITSITAGENEYICNSNLTYYTSHDWSNLDGICANGCGLECPHENETGDTCSVCGSHICRWSYSASGDTITAVCANTDGNCPDSEGTLTILAPADLYADGITAKEATIENNLVDTSVAISYIIYSAPYGLPPKDAGTYTASVTVGGATATVEFTLLNYAAKVTDKDGNAVGTYKTFEDAVTAAEGSEGSTLTLLDDITLTEEQYVYSGKFTLELNGKKIISENYNTLYIWENADLTINDSGEGGTVQTNGATSQTIFNCGTLTIENGLFKGAAGIVTSGTLNFKNGKIEADTYDAIRNSGTVYIYNGSFTSIDAGAINVDTDGTAYIYGGEFSGFCGISNSGTAYIEGGEFKGNSYAAFNLYSGTVEVTGGSFTGTDFAGGYYSGTPYGEWTVYYNEDATLTLKGGEFPNGFVVAYTTANAFLAEDYYYKDADGKLIDVADDAKIINGYVKVSKGADLSEAVVTVDKTEFVYNGQHQAPAVTVTIGGKTLTENVDYAVNARRWENGVPVQWFYYVDAGVYTSVIDGLGDYTGSGDYTGTVEKEFIIKPATVDIIWEGDEFYYTGNPHKLTAKYVDVNGDENPAAITQNKTNTEIGKYIATAVVEDSNYTVNGATINHAYEIKWYDGAPDATFSGTKGENGWYTSEVTVTAPEGYTISTAVDGTYSSEITFGNEENAVYYLKQTENGYIAKVELGEIKCDLADPAAEITMAENKWNSFLNTVTFGYFFKETQSITVTASDETSGVAKIEYFIATEEITDFENIGWAEYTEELSIEPNSKNVIYAKVTDNAGRYVIVNSDGIVLYTDSKAVTSEATYILTSMEDVEFEIDFNGNEVAYVMYGASYLDNTQYTATENGIKLHANYIENAYTAGEYQFTVYIDPLGENFGYEGIGYDKYTEPHGDTPETITLTLTVKKLDGNVEITNDISKTYDGKAVSAPEYDIIGTGDVTVEYKVKGADDSTYTTEAPVNAGEYTVRVSVAETGKSTAASATKDFTIAKKAVTVTATAPDKVYDGTTDILEYSKVTVEFDGAVEGEMLGFTVGKAWYDTADAGTDKIVHIIYAPVASNNIDNYEFPINPEYSTDNCYVEAKADITKKAVTATATASDKQYNGVNDIDKSKIIVILDGIVGGESVETTVETAWIEGKSVGENYLVPVFFSVSGDAAKNYIFPINELYPTEFYYAEATVNIYNDFTPKKGTEYTVNSNDWINNDFVVTANKGYQLSLSNEVNGWSDTLSKSEETENGTITFYVKNKENGAISLAATENYKIDKTKPHGYFSDSHGRGYEYLLLDEIQTEPYYENEDIFTHKYEAWDDASGIANMEYYFSITKLSKAELDSVSGWTEFELDIDIEDIFEFPGDETYSYIRVTDKAGNTIYYVAHLVYDGEMAKINGVLDGFTYYTTQIISVTDNFKLDDVTVNGEVIKSGYDTITLEGNCNATYEIFAYDLAGNPRDEAIITMKPIATLSEPVDNLKEETLKSSDKETIEAVKAKVEKIDTTDATEEEKAELQKILDKCDALLKIIADTQAEIDELGKNADSYAEETVKSSDSDELAQLKEDIQSLIDGGNTTDAEKSALEEVIKEIEALEDKIDETAKEIERIENAVNGYDEETVKSSDEEAINKLKDDIQTLIDSGNVTEEEVAGLEETKADADALTDKIDETQAEIDRIEEAVGGYTEETVKSNDKEAIEQLKEDIQSLINSGNVTEEEIAALEETKADADALTDKITETEEKLEDIKDIENNYNPENVSSDDKSDIEDKIAEIEAVNPDNLTDEQKAEYEETKAGFEALLEEIAAAEKDVADIGAQLEMFDEERVTKFWEDDIEALKAKIDELLADENMGETEKAKLNEYKAQAEKLIEIINTPKEYFSLRFFYLIWDCLTWKYNGILWLFKRIFAF